MSTKDLTLNGIGRFTSAFVPVVKITEVSLAKGGFSALVYQCQMNVDFDGAPTAYGRDNPRDARPAQQVWNSANQKFVPNRVDHFQRNLRPLEYPGNSGGLRDATDNVKKGQGLFHDHNFHWVGVVSATRGEAKANNLWIDDDDFLRDSNSRFPVIQKDGPARGYYVSQSGSFAITPEQQKVPGAKFQQSSYWNAAEVPYCVWPSMVGHGLSLGDFGLVISNRTGKTGGFFFADTGSTTKVGECSMGLAKDVLGIKNGDQGTIVNDGSGMTFIVFPRSGGGRVKAGQQESIQHVVQSRIAKLSGDPYAEELIRFFSMGADPDTFPSQSYDKIKSGVPAANYQNILRGLKDWGFRSARQPIDPNASFLP
jgi:hypothetical protein